MIIASIEDMDTPQERIRGLTGDAKWAADEEIQKRSIDELGALGPAAVASLEEIMAVTSREEIRRHCMKQSRASREKGTIALQIAHAKTTASRPKSRHRPYSSTGMASSISGAESGSFQSSSSAIMPRGS